MKISELKQPYRRMAEYLVEKQIIQQSRDGIYNFYKQGSVIDLFWNALDKGNHPEITPEIKKHFPPDFDFSGEEIKTKPVMQMLDLDTQKAIYTQLAKEGKFDELPETCEFSDAVELEVWDDLNIENKRLKKVIGKFKRLYCVLIVDNTTIDSYQNAQLPTPKIDFSEFKTGDVVEVEYYGDNGDEKIVGYIYYKDNHSIHISSKMTCYGEEEIILNQNIKSITKIK